MSRSGGEDERPVALVLGAAVWSGGRASPALRRRTMKAVALWQGQELRAIIGCGGLGRHAPAEAEVIAALCRDAGVPEAAVFCEDRSTTTEQNIRLALPVLERLGARDVIVVTDFYHLPRARLVARRAGLRVRGAAPPLKGARPRVVVKAVLREIPAFLWYFLRGAGR